MKKIMYCGGGSAGHVIPNIALIEYLRGEFDAVYMGTEGIEKQICAQNGIKFYSFPAVKLVRGKILCNLAIPIKLTESISQAGKILDRTKPDLLFCKGGYVCYPAAVAAKKRKIPVITHESDLKPGLANKLIAKKCKNVLTAFPATKQFFKNGIFVGTPMRQNLFNRNKYAAKQKLGLDMRPTLLVFGGGSGSKIINENLRKIVKDVCRDFNVLHICGKSNTVVSTVYGYKQIEFAGDMGEIYACADAAVARCGANSANELIALKIPTLFIPLENRATRGDQIKNAEYFYAEGLCKVLREKNLNAQTLKYGIYEIINDCKIKAALEKSGIKCGNEAVKKVVQRTILQQS